MKTKIQEEIKKQDLMIFRREDFSQSGLDLGLWDHLVEGLHPSVDEVEVIIVRRRAAR